MSVCTTVSLFLFNRKSFRPAAFCKHFLNLSIRFLNKNIHRENRESVIMIVILCDSDPIVILSLPFPSPKKEEEKTTTCLIPLHTYFCEGKLILVIINWNFEGANDDEYHPSAYPLRAE